MSRMERGAEHALRGDLARMRDTEVKEALAGARAAGDRERQRIIEEEMERRGLDD